MLRKPCSHVGCKNMASRYPRVSIYAKADPHHEAGALQMCMPMPICRDHQADFDIDKHFVAETRQKIMEAMKSLRRAEPDFDSMDVEWAHVGDDLWKIASEERKPN